MCVYADTLKLEINDMTGSIPTTIGSMMNLSTFFYPTLFCLPLRSKLIIAFFSLIAQLEIGTNEFTGTIPTELGQLVGMSTLICVCVCVVLAIGPSGSLLRLQLIWSCTTTH